jgi:molybdopterin-guanine dinucleotide biosynthesis protein A
MEPFAATLAILAGGAGSRMGKPKAWLRVGGEGILEYLLGRLKWVGPALLVTHPGRTNPPGYERFTREVCDAVADEGPLRGLLTALEHCQTPLLLAATVDMPGVGAAQLAHLQDSLGSHGRALGVMLTRPAADGRATELEPFPSAWRVEALEVIASQLDGGQRSLHSLMRRPGILTLPSPSDWPAEIWINLNSPADLEALGREPV